MAKLADALDLGSSVRKDVWVQVPPSAPKIKDPLLAGLFIYLKLLIYFKELVLASASWALIIPAPQPPMIAQLEVGANGLTES